MTETNPAPEPARDTAECLLIYDGECRLCVAAKEGLERLRTSGRAKRAGLPPLRFVPYQSEEAARRLGDVYQPGRPDVAFLIDQEGIRRGLDAFLPFLPGLPGGRLFAWVAQVPLLRPLTYLLYKVVARNRYRWFGTVTRNNSPHRSPQEPET